MRRVDLDFAKQQKSGDLQGRRVLGAKMADLCFEGTDEPSDFVCLIFQASSQSPRKASSNDRGRVTGVVRVMAHTKQCGRDLGLRFAANEHHPHRFDRTDCRPVEWQWSIATFRGRPRVCWRIENSRRDDDHGSARQGCRVMPSGLALRFRRVPRNRTARHTCPPGAPRPGTFSLNPTRTNRISP